ncbi:MAG: pyridoxal 5'-phosphate synthase glutaminase subunit PdxT [bacterium]
MKIGVLALQGAFREHRDVLERLGAETIEVRLAEQLRACDGLVLPGGETTTQRKLAREHGLWEALAEYGRRSFPVLATCAGTILLARRVDGEEGLSLDLLDADVLRNAYGRQVYSFEARLPVSRPGELPGNDDGPVPAIFIRAPRIVRVGPAVSVLLTFRDDPVAVRQGNLLALAFHPELTGDDRLHRYFLGLVQAGKVSRSRKVA